MTFSYQRTYPQRYFAILFTLALGLFLGAWLIVDSSNDPTFDSLAKPISVLAALAIAILAGRHFSATIRTDRAIETDEDETLESWRRVNHSISELRWTAASPYESPFFVHLKNAIPWDISLRYAAASVFDLLGGKVYERLLEDTATENYRIFSFCCRPLFFRVDKTADLASAEADMRCRHMIAEYLIRRPVAPTILFKKRYLKGLVPLPIRGAKGDLRHIGCLQSRTFGIQERRLYQVFHYIEADQHFSGRLEQIESFATKLGMLFSTLQLLDGDSRIPGSREEEIVRYIRSTLAAPKPTRRIPRLPSEPERVLDDWSKVKIAAQATASTDPLCHFVATNLTREIESAIDGRSLSWEQQRHLLLHDVHPHNTLFNRDTCELIFDFSWVGYWAHSEVLAFVIHRFVREFIRSNFERDGNERGRDEYCLTATASFVKAYHRGIVSVGDPKLLPVPKNFGTDLHMYIRASNIEKLFSVLSMRLRAQSDIRGRSGARLRGEERKFVRFMKEANAFAHCGTEIQSLLSEVGYVFQ